MSTADNTHPNLETIRGLREAADWLEQHPELRPAHFAAISFRSSYMRENAREDLTALAVALGEGATEKPVTGSSSEVCIEGCFGNVRVSANALIQDLRDEAPVEPEYEPILPVAEHHDDVLEVFS